MLRTGLLWIGGAALFAAVVAALFGGPLPLVVWLTLIGAVLVGGILFERGRYKPAAPDHPGPGWMATGERFVDPESGRDVTVYYQPSSGERRYVDR